MFIVTPSFEPKSGQFMAYNYGSSITIVNTQTWAVKKTLTDEKVFHFLHSAKLFSFKVTTKN